MILKELVKNIEEDQNSIDFRDAVPWAYPEIITRPMDLKLVKRTLLKYKYKKYDDFFKDL